ncbi:RNA 2',3'-cyclic phosphodiesterase [Stutzerimonas stutzeri]|uniref:RNA 2',3'-cyclic phosphodiesterase n=1 Tax=Stutzerimonas stutzeri TaxID=316 RepID=UPI0021086DEB|nr:RNA 2',3'-cyclic phosphodiesterase [Stutzerimonas stutzeri]MCQ4322855.1 RNA 2',3'-cyclic phosphodiesterase [Stutzerimonas stutzeri]
MPTDKPLRLFFALACPSGLAEAVCNWRDSQEIEGRPVAQANLHLTLAFLGNQPAASLGGLQPLAAKVRVDTFALRLDQLRMIGKDFACLMPSQSPPPLNQLVEQLRAGLATHGVTLDARPFLPHVTLSRQVHALPDIQPPAFHWPVRHFGLYCSENTSSGIHYSELASWPLTIPGR